MRKYILAALVLVLLLSGTVVAQLNTLEDARVGEWAIYATSNNSMQERHSVIARRKNAVVVVKIEVIMNGKVISSRVENYNIANPNFLRGASGSDTINAGGRSYECVVVRRGDRTLYYSNAAPVTGLVAIRNNNSTIKEIRDSGN